MKRSILPFMSLLAACVLFYMALPGSCAGNAVSAPFHSPVTGSNPGSYGRYLCSYYGQLIKRPETLSTVRPLSEKEFSAVSRSVDFIHHACEWPGAGQEGRVLLQRYHELKTLLEEGRIRGDDDRQEISRGTKMTTHTPQDPSDPEDGDIYIHERGLLENVSLPVEGIEALSRSTMPGDLKAEKLKRFRAALAEGTIILTSYLIHECTHREQKKFPGSHETSLEQEKNSYILEIEDRAYSDQYRYLSFLYRTVPDKVMRERIKAFAESLVMEVKSMFPGLKEFNALPVLP